MKRQTRMSLEQARGLALALVNLLSETCERIEIAGSIRRKAQYPNDIELVIVPRQWELTSHGGRPDLRANVFEMLCDVMLNEGILEKRPDRNGNSAWGEKSKRAIFYHEGQYAPADLFSVVEPAQWGVIYALRTGPGKFNRHLVTSQWFRGVCPKNRKVSGGQVWELPPHPREQESLAAMPSSKFLRVAKINPAIKPIPTPEEQDFFRELDFPWWPPEERTEERIKRHLRR